MNNNPLETGIDFKAKQSEFAAYIKDPKHKPAPADVPKQCMDMYRELFFNNINSFLSGNFPVIRALLTEEQWLELTEHFFATHKSTTPHFSEIPEEFLDYLENERESAGDYPFLLELAHYEWVEMALAISKEELPAPKPVPDELAGQSLCVSPVAWVLAYQFPVHKIAPGFIPLEAPGQPTFLIVHRDRQDEVQFMEITPMTYRLLEIIQQNERMEIQACLNQLAQESGHPKPEVMIAGGLAIIKELIEKNILLIS